MVLMDNCGDIKIDKGAHYRRLARRTSAGISRPGSDSTSDTGYGSFEGVSFSSLRSRSLGSSFSSSAKHDFASKFSPLTTVCSKLGVRRPRAVHVDSTKVGILCVIASFVLIYALYSFETARLAATSGSTSRHGAAEEAYKRGALDSDGNQEGNMDILTQAHLSMEKLILELNESRSGGQRVADVEVHRDEAGGGGGKLSANLGRGTGGEEEEEVNPLSDVDFLGARVTDAIMERSHTVELVDHKEAVMGVNLFRYEANPPPGVTLLGSVLLLHGQAFSSQNWLDIHTPHILAAGGYKVVAVDLPGYGKTGGNSIPANQRAEFIASIILAAGLDRPILVSPSMSGSYALPLLIHRPELIRGYVPVAPVGTGEYSPEEYKLTKVPTLIVYGDRDTSLGTMSVSNLRALPFSHILKVPSAGHAAYLNQKELWNAALLKFCNVIFHS